MHQNRWIYKNIHALHHTVTNPHAMTGNYQHWAEFSFLASLAVLGPVLMGAHLYVAWAVIVIVQTGAALDHCGYDIPSPFALISRTVAHHDFHHSKFRGGYSGLSGYPDRLFKSNHPFYIQYMALRKSGASVEEARSEYHKI